jgi:hypothetical protein
MERSLWPLESGKAKLPLPPSYFIHNDTLAIGMYTLLLLLFALISMDKVYPQYMAGYSL